MKFSKFKLKKVPKLALRNKTIRISDSEIKILKERLIVPTKNLTVKEIQNKIINDDIFHALDYLPSNFVDLLFVDPPYNLTKSYNRISFKEMARENYEKWLESWLSKVNRLLKLNASIYICCDWNSSSSVFNIAKKYFIPRNRITWEREKGRGAKFNWKNCSEDIWFFSKSKNYTFNLEDVKIKRKVIAPYTDETGSPKDWAKNSDGSYRITHPSNLWTDITVPFWSMAENTEHPTQKPEKLLAKIILASSNADDLVFDPFLGSGTAAVTAKKLGRNFCGIEIDEYYCCLTEKRLILADKDKSIQGYWDGVFWERNTLHEQIVLRSKSKKKF